MTTLEHQLGILEAKRQAIQEMLEKLRERSLAIFDQIEDLKDQIATEKIQSDDVDWEFLLQHDGGTVAYKELKRRLSSFGLNVSGYNPETNQLVLQVALKSNDSDGLKMTYIGLGELIPHIVPAFGYKHIEVMEHTLSEFGSYAIHIYEDGDKPFRLMMNRWHHKSIVYELDNLMDVLVYIQKRHHCDSPKDDPYF